MRACILSVGTEILFGQIVNTNTVFLSRELNALGIDVMYHYTVGDNNARLAETIGHAFFDCDLIIATGGLGPTEDDLTKETVCRVLHDELVVHGESLAALEEMARRSHRKLTKNNYKQSMMPSRAVVFDNDCGTAPGFALSEEGKTVICMPGPPREMTRMWERRVKPYLEAFTGGTIYYQMLRFYGIGESALETRLLPLIDQQTDPTIATYAKEGECSVRVASKRADREEAIAAVQEKIREIRAICGEYLYSEQDEELHEVLGKELIRQSIPTAVCESCTGGMVAAKLVSVPGISSVFDRGLVTYSEKAKQEELGVSGETLARFTAVSEETAREMAEGLAAKTGCRLTIATTGIAGPEADGDRPAGYMFCAVCLDGQTSVRHLNTGRSDRAQNRNLLTLAALDLARRAVQGNV